MATFREILSRAVDEAKEEVEDLSPATNPVPLAKADGRSTFAKSFRNHGTLSGDHYKIKDCPITLTDGDFEVLIDFIGAETPDEEAARAFANFHTKMKEEFAKKGEEPGCRFEPYFDFNR